VPASVLTVPVQRFEGPAGSPVQDLLAVEEPLEIRVGSRPVSITMRTPGHDFDLAAGFLFAEGMLTDASQISNIRYTRPEGNPRQAANSVTVDLQPDVEIDLARLERHFYTSSSCGVCGKASIEAIESTGCRLLPHGRPLIAASVVHRLPDTLRQSQAVFDRTGGLHASALFQTDGALLSVREDVGRHNALDKLIGAEFLAGRTPLEDRIVLVSGRTSFELVQKAVMAGVAVLAAVGAPSSLAVELAQRFQLTLLGFVRGDRFNIYSGAWRIQ
jgi:FdhD protein